MDFDQLSVFERGPLSSTNGTAGALASDQVAAKPLVGDLFFDYRFTD